jgi:hypothetical protein
VSHLAIDINGKEMKFRRGDEFECAEERATRLGNSVQIIPDIPEQEPMPPDEQKKFKSKKTAV